MDYFLNWAISQLCSGVGCEREYSHIECVISCANSVVMFWPVQRLRLFVYQLVEDMLFPVCRVRLHRGAFHV